MKTLCVTKLILLFTGLSITLPSGNATETHHGDAAMRAAARPAPAQALDSVNKRHMLSLPLNPHNKLLEVSGGISVLEMKDLRFRQASPHGSSFAVGLAVLCPVALSFCQAG